MASPYARAFDDFDGQVWLNVAHQGPLPKVAAAAARRAIAENLLPHRLSEESFHDAPFRLRIAIGRLINASPDDVILGNSTTYGLELIAHSTRWRPGDEVVVVQGDFPATILPWLRLRDDGVRVRFITPAGQAITAAELARELRPSTRVFCTTWVNSFTGCAVDVEAIGRVCRAANVMVVVNGSQAIGARTLDVSTAPIDAVTCCGHKWLCGPYGTGFCWIAPRWRDSMKPPHAYWLAMQAGRGLQSIREYAVREDIGARAFDVFGTASFFNVRAWTASLEFLLSSQRDEIETYDQSLVTRLLEGLDRDRWTVLSPRHGPARSTLVVATPSAACEVSEFITRLRASGVHIAVREGHLRISPHLHNSIEDIDRALVALDQALAGSLGSASSSTSG